jgi:hypothetical protein
MKCIIILHDPTDFLYQDHVNWVHALGDPRVFIETKKRWENIKENIKDDKNFSIIFWKQDSSLKNGEYIIDNTNIRVGSLQKGHYWGKDDLKIIKCLFTAIHNNFEYNYILWTQLGTYWVLPRLKLFLEQNQFEYSGRINRQIDGVTYTSGSASIYSKNIIQLIISHDEFNDHKNEDNTHKGIDFFGEDVQIGCFLNKKGIYPTPPIEYRDIENESNVLNLENDKDILMYRVKCLHQRHLDPIIIDTISKYYNPDFEIHKSPLHGGELNTKNELRFPVTIVTAYYKIPSKFSHEKYLEWISNFLCVIPCYLYIYTDAESYTILQDMRKDFLDRTKIVIVPFNELSMNQFRDVWNKQTETDHEKYQTPELYILWNEKSSFLNHVAMNDNVFQSDYLFWCDIGSFRSPEHLSKLVNFPNPSTVYNLNPNKIYILEINELKENEKIIGENGIPIGDLTYDMDGRFGGGIFGGHKNACNLWTSQYYSMLNRFIENNRFAGKDQSIMVATYAMNKDLVEIVKHKPYFNGTGDIWFYMQYFLS